MNKQYTKKQISEAIQYWKRQVETIDVLDDVFNVILTESADSAEAKKEIEDVKAEVKRSVTTAEDVKKFVEDHDEEINRTGNSSLVKVWDTLKIAVSKGVSFIYAHWKLIILIVSTVFVFLKGPSWFARKLVDGILWCLSKLMKIGVGSDDNYLTIMPLSRAIIPDERIGQYEKINDIMKSVFGINGLAN